MKKLFLLIAGVSLVSFAGCGGGKKDDINANVPKGMVAADLSGQDLPIYINVPDSTNGPLEIKSNPQGGADVKVGKNFKMTIIGGPGDMTMKKNDITHDDVRKFIKYMVEEPNAIVWEWQMPDAEPQFSFYTIIKAGDKNFEVRDMDGEVISEKAVTQMLEAAKTIRLKTPVKSAS